MNERFAERRWEVPEFERHTFFERRHKYLLLVPVLNEGERIRRQLRRMATLPSLIDIEIVDGGSSDGSLDPAVLAGAGIRAFSVKKGPGRLSAQMRIGLALALDEGYEGVVLIDGNDKDDPEEVSRFIASLEAGYDHVQGSRFVQGGKAFHNPLSRVLAVRLIHAPLISLRAGFRYTDTTNGFRAYSRRLLLDPRIQPFRSIFSNYQLHYYLSVRAGQLGYRIIEIPVTRRYPVSGAVPTKISPVRGKLTIIRELLGVCVGNYDPAGPPCEGGPS